MILKEVYDFKTNNVVLMLNDASGVIVNHINIEIFF
jgi:hypothetical protein